MNAPAGAWAMLIFFYLYGNAFVAMWKDKDPLPAHLTRGIAAGILCHGAGYWFLLVNGTAIQCLIWVIAPFAILYLLLEHL